DPAKLSCKIGDVFVFRNGKPTNFNPKEVSRIISKKQHTITVDLNVGKYHDFCYGCDLSRDYVHINADYHT
ncbi:MAG: bifunctional ornithine acetyltransferase/N-acetylglutamate synthase, partial [Planctomycetota bacterium]